MCNFISLKTLSHISDKYGETFVYLTLCLCKILIYLFEHHDQPDSNNDSAKAVSLGQNHLSVCMFGKIFLHLHWWQNYTLHSKTATCYSCIQSCSKLKYFCNVFCKDNMSEVNDIFDRSNLTLTQRFHNNKRLSVFPSDEFSEFLVYSLEWFKPTWFESFWFIIRTIKGALD